MRNRLLTALVLLTPAVAFAQDEGAASDSMITLIIDNAGFAGSATFGLSIFAFAMVGYLLMEIKRSKMIPEALVEEVTSALEEEDIEGAFEVVESDPSFLGKVLAGGIAKVNYGHDAVEKGAEEVWATEQTALMQKASWVQLSGQLAPMLGLFGTVSGMMEAFAVLAKSAGAANPKDLANGIMTSLVTTFIGLLVAIPCNVIYLFIRNKIISAGLDAAATTTETLDNLRDEEEDEE